MSPIAKSDRLTRTDQRPHSSYSDALAAAPSYAGGIVIQCQYCSGQHFRRSRLQAQDFLELFQFRYPVRCLRCSQRQSVSFSIAAVSVPSHVKQRRARRELAQHKHWSEPAKNTPLPEPLPTHPAPAPSNDPAS